MTSTTVEKAAGPVVEFTGVTKDYGAVRAVHGIDLTVRGGESVALLGRDGAGKSTAATLLLGLSRPTSGRISVFGGMAETALRAGRVGTLRREGPLVPGVTVRELVCFVAGTHSRPLPVAETLVVAGLTALASRQADRLTPGQAQRLRFALAMASGPELMVLDEPTTGLDIGARREFWAALRAYTARGNTVVFTTRHLREAHENADRIVVIDQGRKVADGTGEDIQRAVGGRVVAFDLSGLSSRGLDLLPGVRSVDIRRGRAYLRSSDSDATVLALVARGDVRNLEVGPSRLEDAFAVLTSRPAREIRARHEDRTQAAL